MKPRQGEDDAKAAPKDGAPSDVSPPEVTFERSLEWMVPGSETARALEEAGDSRSAPRTQVLSEAIARTLVREATVALPDLAPRPTPAKPLPAAIVSRTEVHPESGKVISGIIEPRPPQSGRSTHVTPIPGATPTPFAASATPFAVPAIGARIGQYEIIRQLGSGGMGVVYLARDDRLGRRVAIKFLQTGNAELTRRFIVEARATARCSHENIVIIYEVGELQGSPFMVLEYLQGQTLAAVIRKAAPMPPSRAVELIVSVVRALASAHEQGIVHRDLKPENILLTDAGTIKVLDFGIAKVLQDEPRDPEAHRDQSRPEVIGPAALDLAARTGIIGTMAYMSPEQWGVGGPIDHRTDIWATGLILFQMLTGRHPLESLGGDPRAWVTDLDSPLPSLRHDASEVPAALAALVDRCLRKRKADRLPDAAALLRALEPFLPGRFAAGSQQVESGPYAGLRAFQEEDAGRFFGRSREIAALATRIRDTPLMAAVGPSGIGKSSLIRAGVVPALKGSGERWDALVVRPGRDPMLAMAGLLAPLVGSSPTPTEDIGAQKEVAKRLAGEPGYLGSALRSISRRSGQRMLLFVDQFEELYTLGADPAERRAFTAALAGAADDATSPVRVVVSIRSDFLGRVAEDPHFMNELAKGLFFLGPPTTSGLREAIVQPAELAGYRFETPVMVDEMLGHLESTPAALPLLQFAAAQLWEARDPRRKMLTEQSYRALGGIAGALVSHADRVIAKLTPDVQALARSLLVQLVTAERTRAVRDLDELRDTASDKAAVGRLIDHLVESRLLVVQTGPGGGGGATVEIVHESLIAAWTTLRRWLDESQEDSLFLEQLRTAARQWQANHRDVGLLWGGDMVEELARFQRRYRGELPEVTSAFADEVFARRAGGARRRRQLVAAAGALSVLLLAAAAIALVVIHNAQKAAENNATVATQAQGQAQRRLQEVETKERERRRAESLQKEAQKEAATANTKVETTNEELAQKNIELGSALDRAKEQRQRAETAQGAAEKNERAALSAEERARLSAQQLEQLLKKERERADRLNAQLGQLVERLR